MSKGFTVGQLPNKRAGFVHIHSGQHECGQAYWHESRWYPCSRLVNHEGSCGEEDNTAF